MIKDEPAVGVCVVTFRRPALLIKMLLQLKAKTLYENYRVYIIIDHEEDEITLDALRKANIAKEAMVKGIEMFPFPVECVAANNRCYSIGNEPYFAWISDDMEVEVGWLREAMKCMQTFSNKKGLVLFHDGIQNGQSAVAGLISRDYIRTELGGIFQNESYIHYFGDTELSRKSKMRNKAKYCPTSIVWHNHPDAKGGHKVREDKVYTGSMRFWVRDRGIFLDRKKKGFE